MNYYRQERTIAQREAGPSRYLTEHLDGVPTRTSGVQTPPPPLAYRTDSSPFSTFLWTHSDSIKMFDVFFLLFLFFKGTQLIRVLSCLVTKGAKKAEGARLGACENGHSVAQPRPVSSNPPNRMRRELWPVRENDSSGETNTNIPKHLQQQPFEMSTTPRRWREVGPRDVGWKQQGFGF